MNNRSEVAQSTFHINPWTGLLVVLSAVFMAILDAFIVLVAAPTIRADLAASTSDIQLVLAVYNLTFGLTLITGGRLGDLYGRRRIFLVGVTLFTAASLAAGLAPNSEALIGIRALQGLAAGLMMPQVFSIIQVSFDDGGRAKAFGSFAFVSGIAATSAQLIGGALLAVNLLDFGWRLLFLINVPIGLIAILATRHFVPESKAPSVDRPSLDVIGVFLATAALMAVSVPLTIGAEQGWPWWVWLFGASFPIALWAFVSWQRRREALGLTPLITLSLTRNSDFMRGNLMAVVFHVHSAALFFALPVTTQEGFRHSALISGALFMPLALSYAISATWSGKLVARHGEKLIVLGGLLLLFGYSAFYYAYGFLNAGANLFWLVPGAISAGIGMGLVQPTINFLSFRTVRANEVGSASGLLNTSFEFGYALGTIAAGLLFLPAFTAAVASPQVYQSAFFGTLVFISALVIVVMVLTIKGRSSRQKQPSTV